MAGVLAALFLVARSMRELQAIMALQDERTYDAQNGHEHDSAFRRLQIEQAVYGQMTIVCIKSNTK